MLQTESLDFDRASGELITKDTWEYKPPQSLDIPVVWNTTLLPHAPNPSGFLGSKVVGEPPAAGIELEHDTLAKALARSKEFAKSDWLSFEVKEKNQKHLISSR